MSLVRSITIAGLLATGATAVSAATVDIFLISGQTAPTNASTPPFTVSGTNIYQLGLDGSNVATSATLVSDFDFQVIQALTYANHTGTINDGETFVDDESRVNSEVGVWDDVGIINNGTADAEENVDYEDGARVTFNPLINGFTDLIIAEDGGLDPFGLDLCSDATCSTSQNIFNGISTSLLSSLDGMSEFSLDDSSVASEMDQAFLFRFSMGVTDYVSVFETTNPDGQALEIDFIGAGAVPPSSVPIPGAMLFLVAGLGSLGVASRKKRS